jgi:uncharacterized protein (DUF1330 family)
MALSVPERIGQTEVVPALQPTAAQLRAYLDDPYDGPIGQVNLLKFRPLATYPEGSPEYGIDEPGSVAYRRYVDGFAEIAVEVGGMCLLMGHVERYLVGDGDWDAVLVMHFPDRHAFLATLRHERYADLHRHREAGLLCQELITVRVGW